MHFTSTLLLLVISPRHVLQPRLLDATKSIAVLVLRKGDTRSQIANTSDVWRGAAIVDYIYRSDICKKDGAIHKYKWTGAETTLIRYVTRVQA
jgi:hypothetical protein